MKKNIPHYQEAEMCRNCAFSKLENTGISYVRPRYFCEKFQKMVSKYKVCYEYATR